MKSYDLITWWLDTYCADEHKILCIWAHWNYRQQHLTTPAQQSTDEEWLTLKLLESCFFVSCIHVFKCFFFVFVFVSPLLTLGPSWHKAAGVDSGKNQKLLKSWSQRRLTAGDNSSKIWFIKLGRAQNPANWDLDAEYNISHHKIENYFVFSLRVLDYGTMRTSAKLWKLFV